MIEEYWEIEFYNGILFGSRTYEDETCILLYFYIPFIAIYKISIKDDE